MKKSESRNPLELITEDPAELFAVSLKSKLLMVILKKMKEDGLTQKQAAKVMQVTQPRVSNLKNGELSKFSIDMLIAMAVRIGLDADVSYDGLHKISLSIRS